MWPKLGGMTDALWIQFWWPWCPAMIGLCVKRKTQLLLLSLQCNWACAGLVDALLEELPLLVNSLSCLGPFACNREWCCLAIDLCCEDRKWDHTYCSAKFTNWTCLTPKDVKVAAGHQQWMLPSFDKKHCYDYAGSCANYSIVLSTGVFVITKPLPKRPEKV